MISCKQSTEWVIKKEDGVLPPKKIILLTAHLNDCPYCRIFAEQSDIISKAFLKSESFNKAILSEPDKRLMEQAIENKIAEG